jgi:hypothetical protein
MIPLREVFPCLARQGDNTQQIKSLRSVSPKDFGQLIHPL